MLVMARAEPGHRRAAKEPAGSRRQHPAIHHAQQDEGQAEEKERLPGRCCAGTAPHFTYLSLSCHVSSSEGSNGEGSNGERSISDGSKSDIYDEGSKSDIRRRQQRRRQQQRRQQQRRIRRHVSGDANASATHRVATIKCPQYGMVGDAALRRNGDSKGHPSEGRWLRELCLRRPNRTLPAVPHHHRLRWQEVSSTTAGEHCTTLPACV